MNPLMKALGARVAAREKQAKTNSANKAAATVLSKAIYGQKARGQAQRSAAVAVMRAAGRGTYTTHLSGLGRELKFKDIVSVNSTPAAYQVTERVNTTGEVVFLNGVAGGTGGGERDGNQCWWKSIEMRYWVENFLNVAYAQEITIMLVLDDAPAGGANVTLADLFGAAPTPSSNMNLAFRERFKVLMRRTHIIPGSTAGGTNALFAFPPQNCFLRGNWRSTYNAATDVIGSISRGAIFLVMLGSDAAHNANPTSNPIVHWRARLRFGEQA